MLRKTYIESGEIRGIPCGDPRITVYKGVPYAMPPVGELRWRAPQPVHPWQGEYVADKFPPIEIQVQPGSNPDDFFTREINPTGTECVMSEDCLYLNIWTPAHTTRDNLPVYLWIHGGGMQAGYSYELEFDGERVAKRDVIFVTVGYRLNAFGFLAHPDLEMEDPEACQGNYALEDLVFALKWLKRNIGAFGGNPEKITIGGQSGGAFGVMALCASPKTKGLITGAIAQSGGGIRSFGYGNKCADLETAQRYGEEFLQVLGVKSIAEARKLSGEKIYQAYASQGRMFDRWSPTVDGKFLLEDPSDAILHDQLLKIPYLFGSTIAEGPGTPAAGPMPASVQEFEKMAEGVFGESTKEFLQLCQVKDMDDVVKICRGDAFNIRTIAVRSYCQIQARQKRMGYFYIFNHDIPGGDGVGAYHGSDMWFTFDSLGRCWRPFTGKHYDLAEQVCAYWTNFVKYGNPNGTDQFGKQLPDWENYTEENPFVMEFTDRPQREIRQLDGLAQYRIDHHFRQAGIKL